MCLDDYLSCLMDYSFFLFFFNWLFTACYPVWKLNHVCSLLRHHNQEHMQLCLVLKKEKKKMHMQHGDLRFGLFCFVTWKPYQFGQ